jgi:iron complex transport system substrate-binding protein
MRDLTYVKLIFFGKKSETELADAKYDGKINPLDFIQIKLIIVGKEKELTVVDTADRIVTVKKPLNRIIIGTKSTLETMRSLNIENDRIAGVIKYVLEDELFYPEFSDYPNVGGWHPDVEKILFLNPDAVFFYATYQQDEREQLEDAGVTVLCFDYYKLENYEKETKTIGYIIGKKEEADEFLEFVDESFNGVSERVGAIPEDERPRVYFEYKKGTPYWTIGGASGWHKNIELAGGNNIFGDQTGYFEVSGEEVINHDPEVIIRIEHGGLGVGYGTDDLTVLQGLRNEVLGRPELADVSAVKSERVYATCDELISSITGFLVGSGYMAKWFYPDIFEDLDPQARHQEYLTRFQGLDYDLNEQGAFAYPKEPVS